MICLLLDDERELDSLNSFIEDRLFLLYTEEDAMTKFIDRLKLNIHSLLERSLLHCESTLSGVRSYGVMK